MQFQSIADGFRFRWKYTHATMSKRDRCVDLKVSEFGFNFLGDDLDACYRVEGHRPYRESQYDVLGKLHWSA